MAENTLREIYVAAAILWRKGKALCCSRPEGHPMAGWWEFPGGKLEKGETAEEALHRELLEELGVTVTKASVWKQLTHDYPESSLRVHLTFFHVTGFAGEPTSREGQQLYWALPEEAPRLKFLPADAELVKELAEPDKD